MTTVLLDSHVLLWWASEPERLSKPAARAIARSDELAVASASWYELAWLAERGRIALTIPIRTWLEDIATDVRTLPTTPAIAAVAVALADSFPGDPSDRLIFATGIEHGYTLVTKDERMHAYPQPRKMTVW